MFAFHFAFYHQSAHHCWKTSQKQKNLKCWVDLNRLYIIFFGWGWRSAIVLYSRIADSIRENSSFQAGLQNFFSNQFRISGLLDSWMILEEAPPCLTHWTETPCVYVCARACVQREKVGRLEMKSRLQTPLLSGRQMLRRAEQHVPQFHARIPRSWWALHWMWKINSFNDITAFNLSPQQHNGLQRRPGRPNSTSGNKCSFHQVSWFYNGNPLQLLK